MFWWRILRKTRSGVWLGEKSMEGGDGEWGKKRLRETGSERREGVKRGVEIERD